MHKQFHIKLQHDKLPRYLKQSRAMHIMACILLIIYALPYLADFSDNWMMLLGISLPAITILAVTLFRNKLVRDINNNRVFRI
jgi:low affinity Fe/Cu permease